MRDEALSHPTASLPATTRDASYMLDPLKSEADAFRLLLYVIGVAVVIIVLVLLGRAIF